MPLTRLIYASTATDPMNEGDIEQILLSARKKNTHNGVTGMLCFAQNLFLQVLEGRRETVSQTFCYLARDPRHHRIVILETCPIVSRDFADWSMGYMGETRVNRALLLRHSEESRFAPYDMSAEGALAIMREFVQSLQPPRQPHDSPSK